MSDDKTIINMMSLKAYFECRESLSLMERISGLEQMKPLYLVLDEDDPIGSRFNETPQVIVEYQQYKQFYPTKCVYRLDRANNAFEKDHIHVYADKNHQHKLYAICLDGTTHDGSKYVLPKKHQEALSLLGIPVPEDGMLEWISFDMEGKMILCD